MIDTMSNHRGTYPCWDYVQTMWKLSSLPMISWIDHIDPWDVWSVGRLSVMISADMTLFERMSCGSEISNTSMVKQLTLHVTDPSSTFLNSSKNTFIFWAIIVILGRYTISCDMIGERRVGWNCCSGVAHFVLPLCVKEFILKTVSYFLEKVLPSVPLEKHVTMWKWDMVKSEQVNKLSEVIKQMSFRPVCECKECLHIRICILHMFAIC